MIPRPCIACGRKVLDGRSRCEFHREKPYGRSTSCRECGIRTGGELYCIDHNFLAEQEGRPQRERVASQPWRKGYRDPEYHRERAAALRDSGGRCARCNRNDIKIEVDHIVPLSTATDLDQIRQLNKRTNLQVLCLLCHRNKTKRK